MKPKLITCLALGACFSLMTAISAQEVNLALAEQEAIPTSSDSIEGTYNHLAGAFADGKADTGWVTGRDVTEHWGRIQWRNRTITLTRVEIDFAPLAFTYVPHKDFFDTKPATNAHDKTVVPGAFELEAHTEGAWKTIHAFDEAIQWEREGRAVVTPKQPLTRVKEIRLKLKSQGPDELFAVRELAVFGPKPPTSFAFRPKWQGVWIWGELDPTVPNFGIIKRCFRQTFELPDAPTVKSAKLVFVAFDRARVFVNGAEVGRSACMGDGMKAQLVRVDVDPAHFKAGKNLLAILGEDVFGWGLRGVLAELWIEKQDGTLQTIATSSAFTSSTAEEPGWNSAPDGFEYWTRARAIGSASGESDTHWRYDFIPPYKRDTARVTAITVEPKIPQPGDKFTLTLKVRVDQPLQDDYGLIVEYGEPGPVWINYMNLRMGEGFIPPAECLPKGYTGEKTLTISDVWGSGVPPRLPLRIRFCNEKAQLALQDGGVGELTRGENDGWLRFHAGKPPVEYAKKGFADVKILPGGRLSVDGEVVAPMAFTTSLLTPDRFVDWAKSGVEIFRIPPHGPDQIVPGEDDDPDAHFNRLFQVISLQVELVHAINPNAKFLLFMGLDMPNDWNLAHPEETILTSHGQRIMTLDFQNPLNGFTRETPNSAAKLRRLRWAIQEFVKRLEAQPYAHSILGIINVEGRAGENYWGLDVNFSKDDNGEFLIPNRANYVIGDMGVAARRDFRDWLKRKYKTKENLQKAWKMENVDFEDVCSFYKFPNRKITERVLWHKRPADRFIFRDRAEEGAFYYDFVRHQNWARAELHIEASRAIKEASGGRLLTSGYIGYVIAGITGSPPGIAQHSGHTEVAKVLDSPYVDFIESPPVYHLQRGGDPIMVHGLIDALKLHDKIWFSEYDTRSYLSPIPDKTFSKRETLESFQKHFAFGITKDTGWWWLEFPFALTGSKAASWFADDDLLREIALMKRLYAKYLTLPVPGSSSECAVIFNVEQTYHTDAYSPANTVGSATANFLMPKLFKLGPAFDVYAQTDLPLLIEKGWHKRYKLMMFVNSYQLTRRERDLIDTHLKKDGRTLAFFYAPGFIVSGDEKAERQVAGIEEITGMKGVVRLGEQHLLGLRLDSAKDNPFDLRPWWDETQRKYYPQEIGPVFYLDPAKANGWKSLATLRLGEKDQEGRTALAQLKTDEWQVFYSTTPDLPLEALNEMAQASGIHQFTKPGVLSWSNPYFLAVHGAADETGLTLTAKSKANWIEPFEKKQYGTDTATITIDLKKGETKFFCLEKDGEWQEFLK